MCLSVQKVIFGPDAEWGKKTLHNLSSQKDRLSQFSVYSTKFAEKVKHNLSQRLSMEIDDAAKVHLAASATQLAQ